MRFILHAMTVYLVIVPPVARNWTEMNYKGEDSFEPLGCIVICFGIALAAVFLLFVLLLVTFVAFKIERESHPPR